MSVPYSSNHNSSSHVQGQEARRPNPIYQANALYPTKRSSDFLSILLYVGPANNAELSFAAKVYFPAENTCISLYSVPVYLYNASRSSNLGLQENWAHLLKTDVHVKWTRLGLTMTGLASSLSRGKNGRRKKSERDLKTLAFFPSPVFSARETWSKSNYDWSLFHLDIWKQMILSFLINRAEILELLRIKGSH